MGKLLGDEIGVVQLAGAVLRRGSGEPPAKWGFNGEGGVRAPPWPRVERERVGESEGVKE